MPVWWTGGATGTGTATGVVLCDCGCCCCCGCCGSCIGWPTVETRPGAFVVGPEFRGALTASAHGHWRNRSDSRRKWLGSVVKERANRMFHVLKGAEYACVVDRRRHRNRDCCRRCALRLRLLLLLLLRLLWQLHRLTHCRNKARSICRKDLSFAERRLPCHGHWRNRSDSRRKWLDPWVKERANRMFHVLKGTEYARVANRRRRRSTSWRSNSSARAGRSGRRTTCCRRRLRRPVVKELTDRVFCILQGASYARVVRRHCCVRTARCRPRIRSRVRCGVRSMVRGSRLLFSMMQEGANSMLCTLMAPMIPP